MKYSTLKQYAVNEKNCLGRINISTIMTGF